MAQLCPDAVTGWEIGVHLNLTFEPVEGIPILVWFHVPPDQLSMFENSLTLHWINGNPQAATGGRAVLRGAAWAKASMEELLTHCELRKMVDAVAMERDYLLV